MRGANSSSERSQQGRQSGLGSLPRVFTTNKFHGPMDDGVAEKGASDGRCRLKTDVAIQPGRRTPTGRKCEFAGLVGCGPAARRGQRQQSALLPTLIATSVNVGIGRYH